MKTRRAAALAAVLCAALAAPSARAGRDDTTEAALFALRAAFSEGDEADQVDAIERGAARDDAAVVEEIARGLRAPGPAVREAAIRALGGNRSPEALKALHAAWRDEPRLRENEELLVHLVRALGRHEDPSSLPLLADRPFADLPRAVGEARIAAIARIRTRDSVGFLIESWEPSSAKARRRRAPGPRFAREVADALAVLTGSDRGPSPEAWRAWWRESGKEFRVTAERFEVPEEVKCRWEAYWGEPWAPGRGTTGPAPVEVPVVRVSGPSADEVREALAGMRDALFEKDDGAAAAGFEEFAGVDAPAVLELLVHGLGSERPAVRRACVRALGWIGTPAALDALHRFYRSSRPSLRDEDFLVLVLKAIGRHGSPSSVHELADRPFGEATWAEGNARILGLARIRRKESVQALMAAMAAGGKRTRLSGMPGASRFHSRLRLALVVLTCQDFGADAEAWAKWWTANEATFEVPRDRPELPPDLLRIWTDFWGEPYR